MSDPDSTSAIEEEAALRALLIDMQGYERIGHTVSMIETKEKIVAKFSALLSALAGMREALTKAAEQFASYAEQHRAKGTVEGEQKAAANGYWAAACRAALQTQERTNGRG